MSRRLAASVDPDTSVYAELAALRRENGRLSQQNGQLQRRISALAPRRKRLETMIHQIQNPNNKMQKRALARQVSIATGSALESQARQNALDRKHNALADRIVEKCSGTASDADFREIMQTPGFIRDFLDMCKCAEGIFGQEQRVLDLASPCYVLGDIHGNLDDLRFFSQKLWTLGMHLTGSSFLFMGDYVDRGMHGIEVVMYLLAYKIKVPHKVFLLRGNHETRAVNGWIDWYKQRCFLYQCRALFRQFGDLVWESVNRVFDTLPFAATVDRSIFCVHGGIPPKELHLPGRDRIEQMQRIPCPVQIPFPSEHLSGAIDSEDEAGAEEDDDDAAAAAAAAGAGGAGGESSKASSVVVTSSGASSGGTSGAGGGGGGILSGASGSMLGSNRRSARRGRRGRLFGLRSSVATTSLFISPRDATGRWLPRERRP